MNWDKIKVISYSHKAFCDRDKCEKIIFCLETNDGLKYASFKLEPIPELAKDARILTGNTVANEIAKYNKTAYGFLFLSARLILGMEVNLSL